MKTLRDTRCRCSRGAQSECFCEDGLSVGRGGEVVGGGEEGGMEWVCGGGGGGGGERGGWREEGEEG